MTRRIWIGNLVFFAPLAFGLINSTQTRADEPIVAGYVENAWFNDGTAPLKAKLDTGAKSSSINAPEYEIFKKKGKRWVTFSIQNQSGKTLQIKRKVERFVRIRRAGAEMTRRPVIKIKVCVGGKTGVEEFTLADRSSMNYQVLIGRDFLGNRILVDSSRSFLVSGRCKKR